MKKSPQQHSYQSNSKAKKASVSNKVRLTESRTAPTVFMDTQLELPDNQQQRVLDTSLGSHG
jgi:hypothetical protein